MDDEITRLLVEWSNGNEEALKELMPLVYDELRKTARHHLAKEELNHSLITGEVINEVYMRLVQRHTTDWQNRKQFFGFAGKLMHLVLVDHARAKGAYKRGDGAKRVDLTGVFDLKERQDLDFETLLALHEALIRLEAVYPRLARQVELRFIVGLTVNETAEALGIARATLFREWDLAKRWLSRELGSP